MLTHDLNSVTVDGAVFAQLLNFCFKHSEFFSFTAPKIPTANRITLQNELSRYTYAIITTTHWFNYITLPDNPLKRIIYHVNNETLSILNKYCHRLFLFDSRCPLSSWNQTLEDLCFFSDGKLFLGTVSHEYICEVFPPNSIVKSELFSIYPHWKEVEDSTEQIKLSDYLSC